MESIKIAHISDLHYRKGGKWNEKFDTLKKALAEQTPELILITGDLVDSPHPKSNFEKLGKKLDELYSDVNAKHKAKPNSTGSKFPYIYSVPGNHDCFLLKGLSTNFILRSSWVEKCFWWRRHYEKCLLPYLAKPSGFTKEEDLLREIYINAGIAIFPLNSCTGSKSFSAQGRINEPDRAIGGKVQFYKEITEVDDFYYKNALKIALLHHHSLPIPYAKQSDVPLEEHLILENSYQFLSSAINNGIDLVFHGHKHTHGTSGFHKFTKPDSPIIVSSCDSSCSIKTGISQFKIVEVFKSGKCEMRSFSSRGEDDFMPESETPVTLLGYDRIRRLRNADHSRYPNGAFCVDRIKKKKKIVQISPLGTGMTYIFHNSVKWRQDAENFGLSEKLRGFNGRIGKYFFLSEQ